MAKAGGKTCVAVLYRGIGVGVCVLVPLLSHFRFGTLSLQLWRSQACHNIPGIHPLSAGATRSRRVNGACSRDGATLC